MKSYTKINHSKRCLIPKEIGISTTTKLET